ncbi:MAG: hypothetical protein WDM84_06000 [Bauldia sp.]
MLIFSRRRRQKSEIVFPMQLAELSNGIRLNYRVEGKSGAPWVLMSNSHGTNLTLWDELAESLASRFQILRYDQRVTAQRPRRRRLTRSPSLSRTRWGCSIISAWRRLMSWASRWAAALASGWRYAMRIGFVPPPCAIAPRVGRAPEARNGTTGSRSPAVKD